MDINTIHCGDSRKLIKQLADKSVHCIITSPPYYALRDYGMSEQMGLEKTPEEYIEGMVALFRECSRVLRDDGTLWVNIGDSYASGSKNRTLEQAVSKSTMQGGLAGRQQILKQQNKIVGDLKPKDLIGIPWMLAFALRADGWYLRQDIVWAKAYTDDVQNNGPCMPESVTDRFVKSHEYIFLLSKSRRYYFDLDSVKKAATDASNARTAQDIDSQTGSLRVPGKTNGTMKARKVYSKLDAGSGAKINGHSGYYDVHANYIGSEVANKRSVWHHTPAQFKEAHFATYPEKLVVDMIKAGCPLDGIILDPFFGAGTTGLVARKLQRNFIGFELNPEYVAIAEKRLQAELGMFR